MDARRTQLDLFVRAAGDGKLLPMMKALRQLNDLDQQDSNGDIALCLASAEGHYDICSKLVMEYRVDPNARDLKGKTAIHYAAAGGHDKIVELLVFNGAIVDIVDENGWNPLHHAAQSGSLKSVRQLLRKAVPFNAQTSNGNTAVHLALLSSKFSLDLLKELTGWPGVRLDLTNNEHESVLDVALRSENSEAIDFLNGIPEMQRGSSTQRGSRKNFEESVVSVNPAPSSPESPIYANLEFPIYSNVVPSPSYRTRAHTASRPAPAPRTLPRNRPGSVRNAHSIHGTDALSQRSPDLVTDRLKSPKRQVRPSPTARSEENAANGTTQSPERVVSPRSQETEALGLRLSITSTTDPNEQLERTSTDRSEEVIARREPVELPWLQNVRRDIVAGRNETRRTTADENRLTTDPLRSENNLPGEEEGYQRSADQKAGTSSDMDPSLLASEICCMKTTIEQQRLQIAQQRQQLDSYQNGVKYTEQEVMDSLFQEIAYLNKQLEDYSEYSKRELEKAAIENEDLRTRLELAEEHARETEQQLHSFQGPLNIRRESITSTTEQLGAGSHGGVMVVRWNGVPVAAKSVHEVIVNTRIRGLVQQEIDSCCRIRHPNIVTVFGAVTEDDKPPRLLMEIMEGSLSETITSATKTQYLTFREQVDIIRDCAAGINYMHTLTPSLLHGDIRSENVLMTSNMTAKLGDLGAAHIQNASKSAGPLSFAYLAPERMPNSSGSARHNTKWADMYSFGIVNLEIITGRVPEEKGRSSSVRAIKHARLRTLCQQMIKKQPDARPACKDLLPVLDEVMSTRQYTACQPKRRLQRNRNKGVDLLH